MSAPTARKQGRYARLFSSIWDDDDFLRLTTGAQRLYCLLLSQADITHVGVLPLTERRWARLAANSTTAEITASLDELHAAGFIVVDESTEEVLVRSYMRYDTAYMTPNGVKALVKACERVMSRVLRDAIERTIGDLTAPPPPRGAVGGTPPPTSPQLALSHEPASPEPAIQLASYPASSSGSRVGDPVGDPQDCAAAALSVIATCIEIRKAAAGETIRNPKPWANKIRRDLETDPRITDGIATGRTRVDIAAEITGATLADAIRADARIHGSEF